LRHVHRAINLREERKSAPFARHFAQEPIRSCASYLHDSRSGRLRECNRKPKEGLGVRWTPGFSNLRRRTCVTRSAFLVLVAALALNAAARAQPDPPATVQTKPDSATSGIGREDPAERSPDSDADERRTVGTDRPPANPPEKDETVGFGSSVDRAPRDIREPFDE